MIRKDIQIRKAKVLILGVTFKENCPDLRNSKVVDVYKELNTYGVDVDIFDPWAKGEEFEKLYGFSLLPYIETQYDAIILAVGHKDFLRMNVDAYLKEKAILYDLKGCLERSQVDSRL